METEITIAQSLRVTDGELKYDEACKRLLSEKSIMVRMPRINLCMKEAKIYHKLLNERYF